MKDHVADLYRALVNGGYNVDDLGGSIDGFREAMSDSVMRKEFYDWVGRRGNFRLPGYDAYESALASTYDGLTSEVTAEESKENTDSINQFLEKRDTLYTGLQDYDTGIVSGAEQRRRDDAAAEAETQAEAMRQRLQEDGTIDRMKESKKEARRDKLRAFGSMLGSTPQVSSFGVSTNVFDSTNEQLADVGKALDAGTEYRQNKLLQEKLDVALDMARAGENQDGLRGVENFGLGLWDSATRLSTWDFGASDIVNNLTLLQIVEKWENDPSSLTATEQKVLDGIGMATAVQELYSDQVGVGYNVGQSLPESASFMMGMALNPASGLGKSLARNAVRTYGRNSIVKNLARIGGDIAETAIMTATTGAGRVVADALERINGSSTYEIGENGVIMYGGQKDQETVGNAVIKAIGANFIENYSEALGEYFDPLLGMSRKVAAGGLRKMNLNKWADALSDVQPSQMTASIRSLREKTKFGGIFGEIMEEEIGMALNTLFVGDNKWSDFVDLETQLTTVLSCAIMSGTLNGVEQVSSVAARRKMEKNAKNAEQSAANAFGEQFSELRESIDQASPEGMVDVLREVYMDQGYSLEQKRKLAEYAAARLQMQYYNAADAKARREVNKTQQGVLDAYEAGRHAQLPTYYSIEQEYRNSEEAINASENAENIWAAIETLNRAPLEEHDMIIKDFTEEEQQLIRQYRYNAARVLGAVNSRAEQAEDLIDEYRGQITPFIMPDGTVTTAILGDNVVFVMEQNENGDAVVYTNDGRKIFAKTRDLEHVEIHNAEALIERFRQSTNEAMDIETENAFEHHPKTQAPQVGLQLQSPEGEVVITAVNDNMVEIVPAVYKDGQVQPKEGAEPQTITVDDAYAWQDDYYLSMDADQAYANAMAEANNMSAETAENEGTPSEEIEQSVSEEVTDGQISETQPTEEIAEGVAHAAPQTARERVPKDDKGNPIYEQTDADTAWDAIVEETEGDTEMAQRVAADMLEDKKAALAKLQNGKPKKGATVAEKIANEKAHAAAIAQAQNDVAQWEAIVGTEARRREAAMSEADRYAAEMEQKSINDGLTALGEPQSLEEYVLGQLAGGAYNLRWSDKENGTKGFGSHTGLSTEEMKARLSMIDSKNGLTPEEIAHSIVENMDASFGEVDVMDVTNMVIDAVSTHASRRSMLNGMVESRAKLLRQQEIAEQEAKDAWYMEQYHATEEELAAYNEYLAESVEEIYGEDTDYEQRIATFAEIQLEYDNQGTDAGLRSSADQGEGFTSDREGGRSVGETEQLDRRELREDADGVAEAEDGRAGGSVSAESDDRQSRIDRAVADYRENVDDSPEAIAAAERDQQRYEADMAEDARINENQDDTTRRSIQELPAEADRVSGEIFGRESLGEGESVSAGGDGGVLEERAGKEKRTAKARRQSDNRQEANDGKAGRLSRGISAVQQQAIDEYTRTNPWDANLTDDERGVLNMYRMATLNELDDLAHKLADKINSGKATPRDRMRYDVLAAYAKSGELKAVADAMGVEYDSPVSLDTIKSLFETFNSDPELAVLFNRVFPLVKEINPTIVYRRFTEKDLDEGEDISPDDILGQYSLQENLIEYNRNQIDSNHCTEQEKASTIVHEMIHAVARYAIRVQEARNEGVELDVQLPKRLLDAAQSLIEVYDAIKDNEIFNDDRYESGKMYGVSSVHEMLSELANPEFREKLKQVSIESLPSDKKGRVRDALRAIKDFLHRMFGWNSSSAYARTKRALDKLIDNYNSAGYNKAMELSDDDFAQQRTYHGSGALFDKFDHSFMGTGEGGAVAGFGTYVTTDRENGVRYAMIAGSKSNERYLYEVEIPDDNGSNYMNLNGVPSKALRDKAKNKVREVLLKGKDADYWKRNERIIDQEWKAVDSEDATGYLLRETMEELTGDAQVVSDIFASLGFVGFKTNDDSPSGTTYVIFNEDDLEIVDNLRFRDDNNAELKEKYTDEQIFDAAKQKFGVTDDIREAGCILPDGSMLDFSGRYAVDGDASHLKGGRHMDHGEVNQIAYDANNNKTGLETNMTDFVERGAIRIHYSTGGVGIINLDNAPTKEQKAKLRQLISAHNGNMDVDFGNGWNTEHHAEYDNAKAARVLGDIDRYFSEGIRPEGNILYRDGAPFFSNAERAVETIKQQKATPEQWLAMVKKDGGLKAGEDKWMGLSDWLNEQKEKGVKTLTKDEVLAFIRENQIEIEEVEYSDNPIGFDELKEEYEAMLREDGYDAAHEAMVDRFGDDFDIAFDDLGGELVVANEEAAATLLGSGNIINSTRLDYTTAGLENKREIALVVPTIEPWNQSDEIHFGDAEVNIVDVPRHDFTGTGKEAIRKAKEWANRELVGEHVANEGTKEEFKYSIDEKSVKKFLSSVSTSLSDNLGVHLSVLKKLPSVIDSSIEAEIHADYKKGEKRAASNGIEDENLLIHRLYGCAKINGELYRVKTTIKERKSAGVKPYTYEVTKIELLDGSSPEGTSLSDASSNSISGAKLLKGVEKSYDKGKFLLDESERVSENSINSEEITAEVERESANLGVKVRIARSIDELPDEDTRKRAEDGKLKGYFDPRTGEVVVYEPNTENANDAKRTILHEIVGHKGLRSLIGEQQYDKAMLQLMYMLPAGVRDAVLRRAERHGWNAAIAMDEYLAEQAERDVQPTWWGKVNAKIRALLRNLGFDVKLTDADVTYLLWRSRKKLQGDDLNDMAVNAILKQAARKSAEADAWNEQAFKDAEMRDFEQGAMQTLRNRIGDAQNEYDSTMKSMAFKQRESWQDSMRSLKVFMDILEKESGKKIADFENAYMYENAMSSANLMEMQMFRHDVYGRLLKAIHELMESGAKYEDVVDYMMAKHGLERNEKMARKRAEKEAEGDAAKEDELYAKYREEDLSGLTALTGINNVADAEVSAMQMVADFEAEHNTDLLWNETRACTQTILNISHDAGILSDEVYGELWNQYEYYIPLRGFDETTAEEMYTYVGDNKSPYNAPIKTAKGRKSKADDPIATIATMAESAIVEANRNRLKQRFLYMVERHRTELASVSSVWVEKDPITGDCVARFANIPNDATPEEAAQAQKAFEERMEQLHEQEPERYYKASDKPNIPYRVEKKANEHEHQVIVKRNGKDVVITINGDPRVAQAINGLTNPEAVDGFSKFTGNVNRFLSANFTTRNPAFVVSNFVRDGFYTNSMVWVKEGSAYARRYNQNWVKATKLLPSLVSKYKKYESGDKSALDMSDPVERAFYEFMIHGGETGYTVINSVEDYKGIVSGDLRAMQGGIVGNAKKAMQAVGNAVDTFGRWAEDTSRFAAYLTSRQMGRTVTKSIWDAKEISVNFNKKGSGRKMTQHDKGLNSLLGWMSQQGRNLYVFWNAGVQGLTNFSKAAKEHPGKMAGLVGAYFGLGMLVAAVFGGQDDDDDYWNLPEYVRRNNICHRVGDKWITLPLPIEIRAIYGMGELAMSWIAGKEDPKKIGMKIVQQVSQVLPIDMMAEGGGLKAFIPSWFKPIAEVYMNTDWTGMPIYRKRTPFNEYDPTWMLAFKSTSPEYVAISRAINEATNENLPSGKENKYDRGWADSDYFNNPAAWEHVVEGYLGGLATTFNQTKKSVMALWNKDLREMRNIPVISRFVKSTPENEKNTLRNDYFEAKDEVDELRAQRGRFRKESKNIDKSLTEEQLEDVLDSLTEMEGMANATISKWDELEKDRKYLEQILKEDPEKKLTIKGKEWKVSDLLDGVTREMITLVEAYRME